MSDQAKQVFGTLTPPPELSKITGISGGEGISIFLGKTINLIFALAGVVFIFMIVLGATQWITSGGEKENISKARSRITNAILGLVVLSAAFFIARIFGNITGFTLFQGQQ
jgi:hypothetical protein